jgi:hypothetical protein
MLLPQAAQPDIGRVSVHPAAFSALPTGQLHFGLANDPADLGWMSSSGVPWRYRYQYLAGGVNTANPWQNWNSPTGAFATNYMNASQANGYLPVFTYYELLQSNPSTGTNESDRDFSNLNNTSTMAAYYANFKLLMQKAGLFAQTVVVHVEPDLWGYLEQRAGSGDASTLSASVTSSGFAEAAGIPNTAQGFAWELLKLRDMYAPNALLAIHASAWGSSIDVASSTDSSINATAVADSTAAFLNSAGIASNPYGSTWNLVFNDLDDHDAGWWEQQGADNAYFTHWWDPTNTRFPNFSRYLTWVAELRARTARPQIAWQVPVGNQYYLTMNNTCGHYQDNVAQYFISHAADLYQAGLIAVLFGSGNDCQTTYTDARGDGVTNNGGVPISDTLGYCNACNTHVSTVADDDGGFLRVFVGLYYSGWKSIGGVITSGPDPSSWGTNRTDVFARGQEGGLWQASWNGTSWSWTFLGGLINADPAAVSWGTNRIDVFVRGIDNALWHRSFDGVSWAPWEKLGGVITSGPDVASWGPNRLDVFVSGTEHGLWQVTWDGTSWSWHFVGGVITSDPGAVSSTTNRLDVFVRGTEGAVWQTSWNGTSWTWTFLGGVIGTGPDVASCAPGHLDVFAIGTEHGLWQRGFNGSTWGPWTYIGGQWSNDPGAVCTPGTNTIQVFERGPGGALMQLNVTGS